MNATARQSMALSAARAPSVGAGSQAFVNWADANPEKWGFEFADGLILATSEAFPCEGLSE